MATAAEIAARIRAEIAAAAVALTLEITANLVEGTPVDTGHARANWLPSIGEAPTAEFGGVIASARDAGIAQILGYKLGDGPLNISNNVPYIDRLIAGSSSQAPPGWDVEAIDRAVATIQARYDGLEIDVTTGGSGAHVTITPRSSE